MPIDVDLSHFPLRFTKFDGAQTVEEVDAYFERMAPIHARKQPWVGVTLIKGYVRDTKVIRRMADWMKKTEEPTRQYCLATAMVSSSAGFRFLFGSVLLIQPLACPYAVCASLDEALTFVRKKAAERALKLPDALPSWP